MGASDLSRAKSSRTGSKSRLISSDFVGVTEGSAPQGGWGRDRRGQSIRRSLPNNKEQPGIGYLENIYLHADDEAALVSLPIK